MILSIIGSGSGASNFMPGTSSKPKDGYNIGSIGPSSIKPASKKDFFKKPKTVLISNAKFEIILRWALHWL